MSISDQTPNRESYAVILEEVPAAKKIAVFRVVRELLGLGLKDAKDLVESVPQLIVEGIPEESARIIEKRLIKAGGKALVVDHNLEGRSSEKTGLTSAQSPNYKPYAVVLEEVPAAKKIAVLRVVRELLGLGLKEAKDLIESVPKLIREGISKDSAKLIEKRLIDAGGKASIISSILEDRSFGIAKSISSQLPNYKPYAVILEEVPAAQKIAVLKVVRDLLQLDLKEAKDLIESVPKLIKEGISADSAKAIEARLIEAGGKASIVGRQS
jgi:ribosomal protein L7/L12